MGGILGSGLSFPLRVDARGGFSQLAFQAGLPLLRDKARSTGFEIESEAQVSDHLSANLAVTYTDARYPNDCAELDPTAPAFRPAVQAWRQRRRERAQGCSLRVGHLDLMALPP
mgnify:CR=1 FL=1